MPDSLRPYLIAAGVLIAAAVGFVALAGGFKERPLTVAEKHARRAHVGGPFPLELRSPQVVAGTSERVLVGLGRPSLGELVAKSPQTPVQQRAYVRSLNHEATALMSALNAKGVRFGHPVLFARVWAGFAATLATKDLPAVQTLGLRVEPVTRFYPAQVAAKSAPSVRPLPTTAAAKTRVAVLDAFPRRWERSYPGPLGVSTAALAPSVDVVGAPGAPRLPAERGGFRLESVVRAELPKARTYIVRTAGSQPLENGRFETYATTDQLLRALEWVVDPNRNGDSRDAMPVALTGLSAPYSGFSDGPSAEAADAAAALGSLVVAPAGNGGKGSGPFGSIGAPAAAPSALAVGALDGSGNPAPASSRGPTYELGPKPATGGRVTP